MSDLVSISETDDLNAEQVQALIEAENARNYLRPYGGTDIAGSLTKNTSSGTSTTITLGTWCPVIDTGPGANRFRHHIIERVLQGDELGANFPAMKYGIRAMLHNWGSHSVSGSRWGLQISTPYDNSSGSPNTAPPWNGIDNGTPGQVAFARAVIDPVAGAVKLVCSPGDGVNVGSTVTSTDVIGAIQTDFYVDLFYDPSVPRVSATFKRVAPASSVTLTIEDTTYLPQFGANVSPTLGYFGGVFAETGNGVSEQGKLDVAGLICYGRDYPTLYNLWY